MSANKVSPKTVFLIVLAGLVFFVAMFYVIQNARRSRAALGPNGARVTFTPATATLANGATQVIKVRIAPVTATNTFDGIDVNFKATGNIKLVSIANPTSFKDSLIYAVTDTTAHYGRILHVNSGDPSDTIPTEAPPMFAEFDLTVQATGTGPGTVTFDAATSSVVSGTLTGVNYELEDASATFNGGTVATNTPVPGGATNTPVPPTNPPGGATNTPVPPTNPPGGGSTTLNMKIKFQGITKKPSNAAGEVVQVKLRAEGSTAVVAGSGTFTPDDSGVYSGSVSLNAAAGTAYTVYVKGPRHIQKKVCANSPVETSIGTYRCGRGSVTLAAGANTLDFSKILMLVGDLPQQDGIVDSYDTSFIRQSFGSTDAAKLTIGDVNRDNIIDTQDMSLVIQALNVKYDEE